MICGLKTEIFSRVSGYHRPVSNWNKGKKEEFADRLTFDVQKSLMRKNRSAQRKGALKTSVSPE